MSSKKQPVARKPSKKIAARRIVRSRDAATRDSITRTIPLGRVATPEEIAGPIVFLCSEWANHITGEVLNVNGGSVLCG